MPVICFILFITLFISTGTGFGFQTRFKQYGLDPTRNETGRYLSHLHSNDPYICHYNTTPPEKNIESRECKAKNVGARDQWEIRNQLTPFFFPNGGPIPGCIILEQKPNLIWICQGRKKSPVPVYHSCWPVCLHNSTLSVPVRDYRCTETREWDGNISEVSCIYAVAENKESTKTAVNHERNNNNLEDAESNKTGETHGGNSTNLEDTHSTKIDVNDGGNNDNLAVKLGIFGCLGILSTSVIVGVILIKKAKERKNSSSSSSSSESSNQCLINVDLNESTMASNGTQGIMQCEESLLQCVDLSPQNELQNETGNGPDLQSMVERETNNLPEDMVNLDDKCNKKDGNYTKTVTVPVLNESVDHGTMQSEARENEPGEGNLCITVPLQCSQVTKKNSSIECELTIDELVDMKDSSNLLSDLGDMLDPTSKGSDTWKGFAKNVLGFTDCKINAIEYRTRDKGHFEFLIEPMKAQGLTLGHLVYYFSQERSRRSDAIQEIAKYHKQCPFCSELYRGH